MRNLRPFIESNIYTDGESNLRKNVGEAAKQQGKKKGQGKKDQLNPWTPGEYH